MTSDGSCLFTYTDAALSRARGVDVDDEGNLYICGNVSNNIHQVSPDGEKIKLLCGGEQCPYPLWALCLNRQKWLLTPANVISGS
jgi:hypothetical protein